MYKREATQNAADLQWLATLLTGSRETGIDVTTDAAELADDPNRFFSTWMDAWSRRLVIARALTTVRADLAASARRIALSRAESSVLPPRSWVLDPGTTKSDLERALLSSRRVSQGRSSAFGFRTSATARCSDSSGCRTGPGPQSKGGRCA